jgi:hypothetical protein
LTATLAMVAPCVSTVHPAITYNPIHFSTNHHNKHLFNLIYHEIGALDFFGLKKKKVKEKKITKSMDELGLNTLLDSRKI